VLSGVDARNIALISERLLGRQGLLRGYLATVVLVTHARKFVFYLERDGNGPD